MTQEKEQEAFDLVDECSTNIDEGVRDALLWLLEDCPKPYIGRE